MIRISFHEKIDIFYLVAQLVTKLGKFSLFKIVLT